VANTITNITPQLLAQGLMALREQAIMTRLVNRSYENLASQRGNVVEIPIPSAIEARDVTPSVTMNSNVDIAPTQALVTLDFWKEAPFHLSDNDVVSVMNGTRPMQASEAVKALANAIDQLVLSKHIGFYAYAGSPGTTPFATAITVAGTARRKLNENAAPMNDRRVVLDPLAEANALGLSNILQFDQRGDQGGIVNGTIGRKLGMDWYMDQNVQDYTPGTGWVTGYAASTVAGATGDTTLNIINATASGTVKVGDIFSYGGYDYVVTAAATAAATTQFAISFYPPLKTAIATGCNITVLATAYTANLVFHRDALAWASRPLQDISGVGNVISSQVDPVSGVALRLEISRQYKQVTFSFDVLGGANFIRRELGAKILG
jgi:hypothetical protein